MTIDLSQVVVALFAALATIYGVRESRKGTRESAEQAKAAQQLANDQAELERFRKLEQSLHTETDRAYAARDAARAAEDAERQRRIAAEQGVERARLDALEVARKALTSLADLQSIVRDEVAREAASTAASILAVETVRSIGPPAEHDDDDLPPITPIDE